MLRACTLHTDRGLYCAPLHMIKMSSSLCQATEITDSSRGDSNNIIVGKLECSVRASNCRIVSYEPIRRGLASAVYTVRPAIAQDSTLQQ